MKKHTFIAFAHAPKGQSQPVKFAVEIFTDQEGDAFLKAGNFYIPIDTTNRHGIPYYSAGDSGYTDRAWAQMIPGLFLSEEIIGRFWDWLDKELAQAKTPLERQLQAGVITLSEAKNAWCSEMRQAAQGMSQQIAREYVYDRFRAAEVVAALSDSTVSLRQFREIVLKK